MRRDLFRAVESILFNYHALTKQLSLREEFIKSKCNYFDQLDRDVVIEELAISEREFYRQRRKAVERCAPFILGPFGM